MCEHEKTINLVPIRAFMDEFDFFNVNCESVLTVIMSNQTITVPADGA